MNTSLLSLTSSHHKQLIWAALCVFEITGKYLKLHNVLSLPIKKKKKTFCVRFGGCVFVIGDVKADIENLLNTGDVVACSKWTIKYVSIVYFSHSNEQCLLFLCVALNVPDGNSRPTTLCRVIANIICSLQSVLKQKTGKKNRFWYRFAVL